MVLLVGHLSSQANATGKVKQGRTGTKPTGRLLYAFGFAGELSWSFPASRTTHARCTHPRIGRYLLVIGPSSVSYIPNGHAIQPRACLPREMVGCCLELRDCQVWNVHGPLIPRVLAERHCLIPRGGRGGRKCDTKLARAST